MGQNPCKTLVEGGKAISDATVLSLIQRHDTNNRGALSPAESDRFLRDVFDAAGKLFDETSASAIATRCGRGVVLRERGLSLEFVCAICV